MGNKLSEPSDNITDALNSLKGWKQIAESAEKRIAALLAELEASKKSNAFLKEQLSQLANFNPDWDMLEACRESWREFSAALKEAEKRLATPVRLGAGVLMVSAYSANSCDSEWHLCLARDSVVSAIRAAGFTVEGDE